MKNTIVIGHSHIICLRKAYNASGQPNPSANINFLLLRDEAFHSEPTAEFSKEQRIKTSSLAGVNKQAIADHITQAKSDKAILCLNGNEHAGIGMIYTPGLSHEAKLDRMCNNINTRLAEWLDFLLPLLPRQVFFIPSSPPIDKPGLAGLFAEERIARFSGFEFEPVEFRLATWLKYCETLKSVCATYGIEYIALPKTVFNANGFLAEDCYGDDPMHGNTGYGSRILAKLLALPSRKKPKTNALAAQASNRTHPYKNLPDYAFWKQSISYLPWQEVDPITSPPFTIGPDDKVATAGSCFAQHISKRLREHDFQFMVVEQAQTVNGDNLEQKSYDFSARYGNIYTAKQLLQLFDRAFGYFQPLEQVWPYHGGGFCDPFRPNIEPDGFASEAQVRVDTQTHLQAVRRMFFELDVFVFTLGLTECYQSRLDGAVYPLAPGVAGGQFDPEEHVFTNFSVFDVIADLQTFLQKLQLINPKAKVIFTVSPVPLVATAAKRHVLVSTVYSKCVLRVAAEEIAAKNSHVCYFPSYEIIVGNHADNGYFSADRRNVTEQGVDHVMRVFMSRMTKQTKTAAQENPELDALDELVETICDEELLAR